MPAFDDDSDEDQLLTKWQPPSFDPPKPPKKPKAPPIQYPTVEEVEAIRNQARQDAYDMGLSEGFSKGRRDGFELGQTEGFQAGYKQSYADGTSEINRLHSALEAYLQALDGMTEAFSEPMVQLAFDIAMRISASETMTRIPFVMAIQEALMRLPRPGTTLYLRICEEEQVTWKKIIDDPGLPFQCTLLIDADTKFGHAYVEVEGARIDVGKAARTALVRSALGLDQLAKPVIEPLEDYGNNPSSLLLEGDEIFPEDMSLSPVDPSFQPHDFAKVGTLLDALDQEQLPPAKTSGPAPEQ